MTLTECKYRSLVGENEAFCTCESLMFGIEMPASVALLCGGCPIPAMVAPVPKDFFSQTANLLLTNQKSGQYRPNPRPCGGCTEPKRRKPNESHDLQFVWPYWHGGANGDEIRYSVRSVEKFFYGRAKCTIIGDKPPWFTGHYIPQQRVPKRTQSRAYRDMLTKVWTMATHPEIDDNFIWMMDDIYFLKPFTLEDLQEPRAERWRPSDYNSWQRLKTASMEALTAAGYSDHDYATHMPHYAEKEKLAQLFDQFKLHDNTLLWEVLYGNVFRSEPSRARPFFARIGTVMEREQIQLATRRSTVLNNIAGAWCEQLREFLRSLMPDMASVETDKETDPVIRKSRARVVKRRPVETHRSFIEAQR